MDIRTKLKELIHDMTDEQFRVFKYFCSQIRQDEALPESVDNHEEK